MKIGLALGGGGARSFCQIGVIEVLEKQGIEFDVITGVSMGSLIGSVYAFTGDSKEVKWYFKRFINDRKVKKIEEFFSRHRKRGILNRAMDGFKDLYLLFSDSFRRGIFTSDEILEGIKSQFKHEIYFENSKIPLGVIAVEYFSGTVYIFNRGKLIPAVVASCAIPGLITPVEINGKLFMDGGVAGSVPVISNHILGGEFIISVENEPSLSKSLPLNAFSVLLQAEKIKNRYTSLLETSFSDISIEIELEGIEWFNFSYFDHCIEKGRESAEKILYKIEKAYKKDGNEEILRIRNLICENVKEKFLTESSM